VIRPLHPLLRRPIPPSPRRLALLRAGPSFLAQPADSQTHGFAALVHSSPKMSVIFSLLSTLQLAPPFE